jgi:hypothetical protein
MPARAEVDALESAYGLIAIELVLVAGLLGLVVTIARALPKQPPRGASRAVVPPLPPAHATAAEALATVFDKCDPLARGWLDADAFHVALKLALPGVRHEPSTVSALMEHATSGSRSGLLPRAAFVSVVLALLQHHG